MDTNSVELHECTNMPPRYSINEEDDSAILFVNNIPSKGDFHLIYFCPFCGERFGPADAATEEIERVLIRGLSCIDAIGYKNSTRAEAERAEQVKLDIANGRIQITILNS